MRRGRTGRATIGRLGWLAAPVLAASLVTSDSHATAPSAFTVQGVLRNNAGALQSEMISVNVALYTAATGGALIATYPSTGSYSAMATNGVFSVEVSDPGILTAITSQSTVWLQLTVNGAVFPMQQVGSELFALESASADALHCTGCITSSNITATGLPGSVINSAVANATNAATASNATGIDGASISGALSAGQVLEYNGTNWVPTTVSSLGGGVVASVTASAPLASTGGTTPNISLTSPLPIVNGGTGSTTQNFVDLTSTQTIVGEKTFTTNVELVQQAGSAGAPLYVSFASTVAGSSGVPAIITVGEPSSTANGGAGANLTGGAATGSGAQGGQGLSVTGGAGTNGGLGIEAIGASSPAGSGATGILSFGGAGQYQCGPGGTFTGGAPSSSAATSVLAGDGVDATGGSPSTGNTPGAGVNATGGSSSWTGGLPSGGTGVIGTGGSVNGFGGTGVLAQGGNGNSPNAAIGLVAEGGLTGSSTYGDAADLYGNVGIYPNQSGTPSFVDFGEVGVAAPSDTSAGWKIKLYDGGSAGQYYGLGMAGGTLWSATGSEFLWTVTNATGAAYAHTMLLDSTGHLTTKGAMTPNGTPDLAETIASASDVGSADVVCADPAHAEHVVRCRRSDRAILGVISDGSSALLINAYGTGVHSKLTGQPLVLAGRVPVKVSLENGPVAIGDFLGPSSLPGVAMRLTGPGPSVGIALAPFDGRAGAAGTVLCLVKVGEANVSARVAELETENERLRARLDRVEHVMAALLGDDPDGAGDRLGARPSHSRGTDARLAAKTK